MEINIYEDGQVIHLETYSNDCSVATVCNGNVIENQVSGIWKCFKRLYNSVPG